MKLDCAKKEPDFGTIDFEFVRIGFHFGKPEFGYVNPNSEIVRFSFALAPPGFRFCSPEFRFSKPALLAGFQHHLHAVVLFGAEDIVSRAGPARAAGGA